MSSRSPYEELQKKIILDRDVLHSLLHSKGEAQGSVVFVKGVYDLLHMGHVRSFYNARQYGDILVVAVNSDHAVRQRKGAHRPIIGQEDRMEMIAALNCVDWVTLYHETTPFQLIKALQPDFFAASHFDSLSSDEKLQLQGMTKLVTIAKIGAASTTEIIRKIKDE